MGLVSPQQSSPGDTIEADDINNPVNQLAAVVNGNIEAANLADSAVTTAKLATATRKTPLHVFRRTSTGVASYPDSATNSMLFVALVPDNYVSGDITVKVFFRGPTSGNIRVRRSVYRFRQDTATSNVETDQDANLAMGTGSKLYTFTVAAAAFQAGDTLRFDVGRLGSDGNDTASGDAEYDGGWWEYTGRA